MDISNRSKETRRGIVDISNRTKETRRGTVDNSKRAKETMRAWATIMGRKGVVVAMEMFLSCSPNKCPPKQ